MKIEKLYINNFKSLVDFELINPNPFSVFIGPNASGKSNVFEALEFLSYGELFGNIKDDLFGGPDRYLLSGFIGGNTREFDTGLRIFDQKLRFELLSKTFRIKKVYIYSLRDGVIKANGHEPSDDKFYGEKNPYLESEKYFSAFSRIFVNNSNLLKLKSTSSQKLAIDVSNLEDVLKRILQNKNIREEMLEWLELLIPEFENINVHSDNISGHNTLFIKEKYTYQPFDKTLISNGTYNIIALLIAVYQSEEPQFLCIEEPENGLNPYVIKKLVDIFRQACEEKGHVIWLNTHSQTLVNCLKPEEIILIDKVKGITRAKQLPGDFNLHGLPMDEAWLTNSLEGGVPW